jgi:hypothetical protein
MNTLILILIILALILLLITAFHYLGINPFKRDSKNPRQGFTGLNPLFYHEKKKTHGYQAVSSWNDVLEKSWLKTLSGTKDPAAVLEKAIEEYKRDPGEKNMILLIRLSNHISNRIRYDENIDGLIEKISEMIKKS